MTYTNIIDPKRLEKGAVGALLTSSTLFVYTHSHSDDWQANG